jgi:hypothetical protein
MDRVNQQHMNIAGENVSQKTQPREHRRYLKELIENQKTPIPMKHEYFRSPICIYSLQLISI